MRFLTRSLVSAVASLTSLASNALAGGDGAVNAAAAESFMASEVYTRNSAAPFVKTQPLELDMLEKSTPRSTVTTSPPSEDASLLLVVGIKTSVLHHFSQRQAIRETWANASQLHELAVRVLFLGCEPDLSPFADSSQRATAAQDITREKNLYGDLLTGELECVDSYAQLLRKTVNFFAWVVTSQLNVRYVMIADDDVYINVARLVDKLKLEAPAERFYGGYVFKELQPQRDPSHKNVISVLEYPMSTLPPFAGGPHYVLSVDVVRYISRNRNTLRGLRGLDDVSIALWLLALQIRPVHIPEFVLLRTSPCHDLAIAVADLSPSSVRQIHHHRISNASLCDGIVGISALRQHRSIMLQKTGDVPSGNSDTKLTWEIYHDFTSYALHVGVTISVATHQVSYFFVPSATSYESGLCLPGANLLLSQLYVTVGSDFCEYHRRKLLAFMDHTEKVDHNFRALLTLPRHNLVVLNRNVKTVGLSRGARYARILIECLLVELYPASRIRVLDHDALNTPDQPPLDLFFFSILPEDLRHGSPHSARYLANDGRPTQLLMISGEAWLPEQLDPQVTLITTLADRHHPKQIYLPVASTVFGEILQHTPVELLQSFADRNGTDIPRRFCAYLYARCDRLRREYMFDLLNDVEPVDALGVCQGMRRNSILQRSTERYNEPFYTDLAIAKYTNYKFVIAFENLLAPGYVTEKIVTAFLAGAIPIYYGHSPTVSALFNHEAFINCGDFESLRACAERVILVNSSPVEYEAMRRAAPITNRTAFLEAYSWHPAVGAFLPGGTSSAGQKLKQMLEPGQ